MARVIEGHMLAEGFRFAIVASRWNSIFSERLIEGALDTLKRHGAKEEDVDVVKCPGSFEVPMVAARLVEKERYDAVICLGVLIRGSTPHFDYIASEATKGIGKLGIESNKTVLSFGIITCDSLDQAIERSGSKVGNKGVEATLAAIEMVNLYKEIEKA